MITDKLMMAAVSGGKTYIEDVFSAYTYTGNGANQLVPHNLALATGFNITPGTSIGGGYFVGFISTAGNGVADYYLIVAPKATGEQATTAWGPIETTTGITSVIDGPGNTASLAALAGTYAAADWCAALDIGGFTDWYLPAKNELEVLYFNLKPGTTANNTSYGSNANAVSPEPQSTNYSAGAPAQTGVTLFQTGQSEAFVEDTYWSSTEGSADLSWVQYFQNGFQTNGSKDSQYWVRAVRRVAV